MHESFPILDSSNKQPLMQNNVNFCLQGGQYDKPKKVSNDSGGAEGDEKPLVYSTVAAFVRTPPKSDDPVAYSSVQHEKGENVRH